MPKHPHPRPLRKRAFLNLTLTQLFLIPLSFCAVSLIFLSAYLPTFDLHAVQEAFHQWQHTHRLKRQLSRPMAASKALTHLQAQHIGENDSDVLYHEHAPDGHLSMRDAMLSALMMGDVEALVPLLRRCVSYWEGWPPLLDSDKERGCGSAWSSALYLSLLGEYAVYLDVLEPRGLAVDAFRNWTARGATNAVRGMKEHLSEREEGQLYVLPKITDVIEEDGTPPDHMQAHHHLGAGSVLQAVYAHALHMSDHLLRVDTPVKDELRPLSRRLVRTLLTALYDNTTSLFMPSKDLSGEEREREHDHHHHSPSAVLDTFLVLYWLPPVHEELLRDVAHRVEAQMKEAESAAGWVHFVGSRASADKKRHPRVTPWEQVFAHLAGLRWGMEEVERVAGRTTEALEHIKAGYPQRLEGGSIFLSDPSGGLRRKGAPLSSLRSWTAKGHPLQLLTVATHEYFRLLHHSPFHRLAPLAKSLAHQRPLRDMTERRWLHFTRTYTEEERLTGRGREPWKVCRMALSRLPLLLAAAVYCRPDRWRRKVAVKADTNGHPEDHLKGKRKGKISRRMKSSSRRGPDESSWEWNCGALSWGWRSTHPLFLPASVDVPAALPHTWISLEEIDDDHCDCPDTALDEPFSSACAGQRPPTPDAHTPPRSHYRQPPAPPLSSQHQMKHWCPAEVRFVPLSRVHDGVSDCCDGSDELRGSEVRGEGGIDRGRRVGGVWDEYERGEVADVCG